MDQGVHILKWSRFIEKRVQLIGFVHMAVKTACSNNFKLLKAKAQSLPCASTFLTFLHDDYEIVFIFVHFANNYNTVYLFMLIIGLHLGNKSPITLLTYNERMN